MSAMFVAVVGRLIIPCSGAAYQRRSYLHGHGTGNPISRISTRRKRECRKPIKTRALLPGVIKRDRCAGVGGAVTKVLTIPFWSCVRSAATERRSSSSSARRSTRGKEGGGEARVAAEAIAIGATPTATCMDVAAVAMHFPMLWCSVAICEWQRGHGHVLFVPSGRCRHDVPGASSARSICREAMRRKSISSIHLTHFR